MIFTRAVLESAFPNSPRAVAAFERLDQLLSTTNEDGQTLADQLAAVIAELGDSSFQPSSATLTAIAGTTMDGLGVFELVGDGAVLLHPVDGADDSSLVPRNKLVSYAGEGTTGNRPTLSSQRRAIYWDTTLGKPIFWRGAGWHDFTGAAV